MHRGKSKRITEGIRDIVSNCLHKAPLWVTCDRPCDPVPRKQRVTARFISQSALDKLLSENTWSCASISQTNSQTLFTVHSIFLVHSLTLQFPRSDFSQRPLLVPTCMSLRRAPGASPAPTCPHTGRASRATRGEITGACGHSNYNFVSG
jgi:hypothetical protein